VKRVRARCRRRSPRPPDVTASAATPAHVHRPARLFRRAALCHGTLLTREYASATKEDGNAFNVHHTITPLRPEGRHKAARRRYSKRIACQSRHDMLPVTTPSEPSIVHGRRHNALQVRHICCPLVSSGVQKAAVMVPSRPAAVFMSPGIRGAPLPRVAGGIGSAARQAAGSRSV